MVGLQKTFDQIQHNAVNNYDLFDHDVPSNVFSPVPADTGWIVQYIQFILLISLKHQPPQINKLANLHSILTTTQHYFHKCSISPAEEDTRQGVFYSPCGKIFLTSPNQHTNDSFSHYEWHIHGNNKRSINLQIHELHFPSSNCSYNYLLLDNIKLCATSGFKSFYFNNGVVVKLQFRFLTNDKTLLSLVFQESNLLVVNQSTSNTCFGHYNASLQLVKRSFMQHVSLQVLRVYHFNTHYFNEIIVDINWQDNSRKTSLSVYDGPNSKSPLLVTSEEDDVITVSTLFIVTLYYVASNYDVDCASISLEAVKKQSTSWLVTSNQSIIHTTHSANSYQAFNISLALDRFINLKLKQFRFSGSDNAACYLGGFLIVTKYIDSDTVTLGPFCDANSLLIFEDDRLGGFTLGTAEAELVVYMFAGHVDRISLHMDVCADVCAGYNNPFKRQRITYGYDSTYYLWGTHDLRISRSHYFHPVPCIKVQLSTAISPVDNSTLR